MAAEAPGFDITPGPDSVLWLSGEFDLAGVDCFVRVARSAVDSQSRVVLDLSHLEFIDVAGIRAILMLASDGGGEGVVLRRPKENVRRVIDLLGIEHHDGIRVER